MAKDIPKVPFTKANLYQLVNRDLQTLMPQQQAPQMQDPLAKIRAAIQTRKGLIGGRPQTL